MKPRLLYSDVHFHAWDAFSATREGINTRLITIAEELERAYDMLHAQGGDTAYCGGDLFHVRGTVATSVLVPVLDFFAEQRDRGIKTYCISGNHDLETNETTWAGSLISALESVGVKSIEDLFQTTDAVFVPWHSTVAELKNQLERLAKFPGTQTRDLIIHAPVNGVIMGIPDHGLDPQYLAGLGFRRVFAGHYHNHVDFGNGVYSIGATTHQTWGDVGTKAGFLMITDDEVKWHCSLAPKFVDLDTASIDSEEDLIELVDGNYVRVSLENPSQEQMAEARKELREKGAEGVVIRPIITAAVTPGTRTATAKLSSLDKSVIEYAEKKGGQPVAQEAQNILNTVRSAA